MPPQQKTTKVLMRRRKFINVDIPLIRTKIELIGENVESTDKKTIKLDLTRQLKGKSVEAVVKVKVEDGKAIAYPTKIKLMSFFIRRMIRKRISYIEDSFEAKSQESLFVIKPFLITRKRVSRSVKKTLRNRAHHWLKDYIAERKDSEIFNDIIQNRMQKALSLMLKKTYPLSLCEIRVIEIKRALKPEEVPKIEKKKVEIEKKKIIEEGLDQFQEIEDAKIKEAEDEIKIAQKKAIDIEEKEIDIDVELTEKKEKKPKKITKKKEEKIE